MYRHDTLRSYRYILKQLENTGEARSSTKSRRVKSANITVNYTSVEFGISATSPAPVPPVKTLCKTEEVDAEPGNKIAQLQTNTTQSSDDKDKAENDAFKLYKIALDDLQNRESQEIQRKIAATAHIIAQRPKDAPHFYLPLLIRERFDHLLPLSRDVQVEAHALFLDGLTQYFQHYNPGALLPSIDDLYRMQGKFYQIHESNHSCSVRCKVRNPCFIPKCNIPEHHHHDSTTGDCLVTPYCRQLSYREGQRYMSHILKKEFVASGVVFVCGRTGSIHCCTDACTGVYNDGIYSCPISSFVKPGAKLMQGFTAPHQLQDNEHPELDGDLDLIDYGDSNDEDENFLIPVDLSEQYVSSDEILGLEPFNGSSRSARGQKRRSRSDQGPRKRMTHERTMPVRTVDMMLLREMAYEVVESLVSNAGSAQERKARAQKNTNYEKKLNLYLHQCKSSSVPVNLVRCAMLAMRYNQINTSSSETITYQQQAYIAEFIYAAWKEYVSAYDPTYQTKAAFYVFCRGMLFAMQKGGIKIQSNGRNVDVVRTIQNLKPLTSVTSPLLFSAAGTKTKQASNQPSQFRDTVMSIRGTFQRLLDTGNKNVTFERLHDTALKVAASGGDRPRASH